MDKVIQAYLDEEFPGVTGLLQDSALAQMVVDRARLADALTGGMPIACKRRLQAGLWEVKVGNIVAVEPTREEAYAKVARLLKQL